MPLPAPQARSHLHTRAVVFRGYHREDGLWDIEAELTDTKTYDSAFLKQHLLSCISSKWCDKAEVPLRFARMLGFARTGPRIEELVWNRTRALQRGEQVQAEGRGASTRYRMAAR